METASRALLGEIRNLNIDYILDKSCINVRFGECDNGIVLFENTLVLRKLMVKNLRMKYCDVYNLLSNNSV